MLHCGVDIILRVACAAAGNVEKLRQKRARGLVRTGTAKARAMNAFDCLMDDRSTVLVDDVSILNACCRNRHWM